VSPRILLVEDDRRLGEQVVETLRGAGHDVVWLRDGDVAMRTSPVGFDLAILDLMLPGAYGLDVLKQLRRTSALPVLVLSAVQATPDKVRALALGADDFVSKPFWPEELLARIEARLRRPEMRMAGRVEVGRLMLDLEGRTAAVDGEAVALTRLEFDLLAALARRPGAAVSRAWLVDHVLDAERDGADRALDVHVSRIRRKLGAAARQLATVWGVGYRLEAHAVPEDAP
jgi:two-component system response regulator MtrA